MTWVCKDSRLGAAFLSGSRQLQVVLGCSVRRSAE